MGTRRNNLLSFSHVVGLTFACWWGVVRPTRAWVPTSQRLLPTSQLAAAMSPLFPTRAWEGKEFRVNELQDMFVQALQHFQELMASSPSLPSSSTASFFDGVDKWDTDMKIAASVATAVRGTSGVVSNAELYVLVQQGLDHFVTTLAQVLAQLEGLTIEQKVAAALATVVISYPISYQHYQNELAEEERKAAEKKAFFAKQKRAAAAAAASTKTDTNNVKNKGTKKSAKETAVAVAADETKLSSGPKGTKKEEIEQVLVSETKVPKRELTPTAFTASPPDHNRVAVKVPASPRVMESIPVVQGNRQEDGGMGAYATAYAAMLSQLQATNVADAAVAPTSITDSAKTIVRSNTGGTSTYLNSLSRQS